MSEGSSRVTALLLDTCAVMWLAAGVPISLEAEQAVARAAAAATVYVSAVTAWELSYQFTRGRLRLAAPFVDIAAWYQAFMAKPGLAALSLTTDVALQAALLPELDHHRDPADRFLIATARQMSIPIVTRDRVMLWYAESGHISCIPC